LAGASFVSGFNQIAATGILIHGSASAFERPATAGVLPDIVSVSRVQQANALLSLNRQVVGIAGAALGSWLINSVGPGYALGFDFLTFFIAGGLMLTLAKDLPRTKSKSSPLADFQQGGMEFVRVPEPGR